MMGRYLFFVGLCAAGVTIRTTYEILKKNGRIDTRRRAPMIVLIAAMSAFLGSWIFICSLDPLRLPHSQLVRWLGFGLSTAGVGLAIAGVTQLKAVENVDHLVTTGPFVKLRHPMYTGFILWISGWVLAYGALSSISIALISIGNVLYWRRLEERALESRFGDDFRRYRQLSWF
jgi:protein-S-isoprenylcysteine O-methyltransferase Ste14